MPTNSNQPYSFIGKDNASSPAIYYTYVAKMHTSAAIMNPTIYVYCAGTDRTSDRKWLAAKYVPCSSSSVPSSTYLGQAIDGDTRLRFDRRWNGSSWSSVSGYAQGDSTNVIIPKGYFFVYIAHNTTSIDQHTMSTMRAWSATVNPPRITATDAPTYTITYNANGGGGSTSSQTVVQGETTQLSSNGFTAPPTRLYTVTLNGNGGNNGRPTYGSPVNKFYRWIKDSASGTTYYNEGADFKPEANTTFYAQWYTPTVMGSTTRSSGETDGYTVTLNANGGNCDISSLVAKDAVTYEFNGWNSKKDGSGTNYNSTSTYKITSTRTIYAKWIEEVQTGTGTVSLPSATNSSSSNKTITLNYQGATGGNSTSTTTYKKTTTKAFKGWGTSSSATSGSTGTYKPAKDITLYAVWGSATYSYGAASLPTPTKTGYTFMGWATTETANSGSIGSFTPTTDVTVLYAIWEPDGNVRIYVDGTYKMALAYIYAPSSSSDIKPWKLTLVYLKNPSSSSDTKPWKLVAG